MASPARGSYATDEKWQRRVQHDGYQRDPYPWTPEMVKDYNRYKDANHQHGHDQTAYETERQQRGNDVNTTRRLADPPRDVDKEKDIWCPLNLTREDHEHLAVMASTWNRSAAEQRDLRKGFHSRYPQAYGNSASRKTHEKEVENVNNSVTKSRIFMDEHFRYGGQFMLADPYDSFDLRTGGSYDPGPNEDNPRQRLRQKYP